MIANLDVLIYTKGKTLVSRAFCRWKGWDVALQVAISFDSSLTCVCILNKHQNFTGKKANMWHLNDHFMTEAHKKGLCKAVFWIHFCYTAHSSHSEETLLNCMSSEECNLKHFEALNSHKFWSQTKKLEKLQLFRKPSGGWVSITHFVLDPVPSQ